MQLSTFVLWAILAATSAIASPTPKISGLIKPQHHYISTPAYNDRATAYLAARAPMLLPKDGSPRSRRVKKNDEMYEEEKIKGYSSHGAGGTKSGGKKRGVEEMLETRDVEQGLEVRSPMPRRKPIRKDTPKPPQMDLPDITKKLE